MDYNNYNLKLFTTRMRQLILQFKETKQENKDLYAMIEEQEKTINELKAQIVGAQKEYDTLKMAKLLSQSEGSIEEAKQKVQRIIRNIDKCIALINNESK